MVQKIKQHLSSSWRRSAGSRRYAKLFANKELHLRRKWLRRSRRAMQLFVLVYIVIAVYGYFTNPFTRFTVFQTPIYTNIDHDQQINIKHESELALKQQAFYRLISWIKSGQYIVNNPYFGSKKTTATTIPEIIAEIHQKRFDPEQPYLISGDHFSSFYPRSLGIFYHSILDPRTALSDVDWSHRQQIYLQSLAYALNVFHDAPKLATTIMPIGSNSVSLINIYAPPSDTLYSLLYALNSLRSTKEHLTRYPFPATDRPLQTIGAATELLSNNQQQLRRHLQTYLAEVVDDTTGLIKPDIFLSATKDNVKRQSAFYDAVILWKTLDLAMKLELIPTQPARLSQLKQQIIDTYWNPTLGCFNEDLSPPPTNQATDPTWQYSSDWYVVLMTDFLNPYDSDELKYYQDCVATISRLHLNRPLALKYQTATHRDRLHWWVKLFATDYGSTTIWSNWGMEYVKSLVMLFDVTGKQEYLTEASYQINQYRQKMQEFRCYPEVYAEDGQMFRSIIYKSVCQTGWVVSFEQAEAMVESRLAGYNPIANTRPLGAANSTKTTN